MTTCKEIQELLEKSEIENFKYELKSSRILKNDNWKDKLAKEFDKPLNFFKISSFSLN